MLFHRTRLATLDAANLDGGPKTCLLPSFVSTYRQAKFVGVYKGVDMLYYGTQDGKLEYDFVVKPGADPKAIKLAFFGATGARITANSDLALQTAAGEICWQRPVTYQMIGSHRKLVVCAYNLKREGHQAQVGFQLARYDTSRPVVIDPSRFRTMPQVRW